MKNPGAFRQWFYNRGLWWRGRTFPISAVCRDTTIFEVTVAFSRLFNRRLLGVAELEFWLGEYTLENREWFLFPGLSLHIDGDRYFLNLYFWKYWFRVRTEPDL